MISIFENDGKIPHFHLLKYAHVPSSRKLRVLADSTEHNDDWICICIKEPYYFSHSSYRGKLSPNEIDTLIRFLKSPNRANAKLTNWEAILFLWNSDNVNNEVSMDLKIPEYKSDMDTIQEAND